MQNEALFLQRIPARAAGVYTEHGSGVHPISSTGIKYEYEPHTPKKRKGINWLVCQYCGLMYLRNPITDWCIKKGCNAAYHPDYKKSPWERY